MKAGERKTARPYNLPPHGTRNRYRNVGCRCVGCTRGPHGAGVPEELKWPFRWLDRKAGSERIAAWFTPEQIATWKVEGLGDFEADEAAIVLGYLPNEVWPGYMEAGLDTGIYP